MSLKYGQRSGCSDAIYVGATYARSKVKIKISMANNTKPNTQQFTACVYQRFHSLRPRNKASTFTLKTYFVQDVHQWLSAFVHSWYQEAQGQVNYYSVGHTHIWYNIRHCSINCKRAYGTAPLNANGHTFISKVNIYKHIYTHATMAWEF